jgi:glycosyltransferase involved in cell wall biosynthesis
VSILIPVFNREKLIEETIKSALAQTYANIEVIVVDNKSTDNTWQKLEKLALEDRRIKIFQNETNIGPVRNWKRCVNKASGQYGKILWSDDLIVPEFVEKTIPYLENDDVGFVFTGTEIIIDGTDKKSSHYFIGNSGLYNSEKYINGVMFIENYPVSPGCALFRLKDIKQNLLVNIPNKIGSDFAMHAIGNDLLIFLLTAHQYKAFAFVNEKLSIFRAHGGSISIQSNSGILPLHYNLAMAYFIENHRKDLVKKLNSKLWMTIIRNQNMAVKYDLNIIENYYIKNIEYSLHYLTIVRKIIQIILNKSGYSKWQKQ